MARKVAAAASAGRIHYAWTIVAVAFVTFLAAAGIRSASSVFIVPLEQEFGWSRATISFAIGVQLLAYGLIGPFSAGLVDRFGLRNTLMLGSDRRSPSFRSVQRSASPSRGTCGWSGASALGSARAAPRLCLPRSSPIAGSSRAAAWQSAS